MPHKQLTVSYYSCKNAKALPMAIRSTTPFAGTNNRGEDKYRYLEGCASCEPTTAAMLGFLLSPTGGWVTSAPRKMTGSLNTCNVIHDSLESIIR
jgi:hypothetical protein